MARKYSVLILCRKCDGLVAEATAYDSNIENGKYPCKACGVRDAKIYAIVADSIAGKRILRRRG